MKPMNGVNIAISRHNKKKNSAKGRGGSVFTFVDILFQKERLHEIAEIRVLICRGNLKKIRCGRMKPNTSLVNF